MDLQQELALTYLFIAHDLSVVRHISDRVGVMYLGRLVEVASRDQLFDSPQHPYTQGLMAAVPVANPEIEASRPQQLIVGEVPSVRNPPSGCPFTEVSNCHERMQHQYAATAKSWTRDIACHEHSGARTADPVIKHCGRDA